MEFLITQKSADYELLDSGDGQKLERYGEVVLVRPDPQVLWGKSLQESEWQKASAVFNRTGMSGKWKKTGNVPEKWNVTISDITFSLELLPSKHIGLFPEQSAQWRWLAEKIKSAGRPVSVLNLFAYTGGATLACAQAGADVTHIDASEWAVTRAKENAELSGLSDKSIRYIVDDARKFVEREIKRGKKYDIILLDPPVYGKGEKKQVWKIEEDLLSLLTRIRQILSDEPVAIVLNGYASVYSHITYKQLLETVTADLKGAVSSGELAIQQTGSERLLPCGIFARWDR